MFWIVLIHLSFFSKLVSTDGGHCIWFEECGIPPGQRYSLPCIYNGTAKELPNSLLPILQENCPDLVESSGKTYTCCSAAQLQTMVASFSTPRGFISDCPSCWYNFRKYFCTLTCSPDQSNFMYIQNTTTWQSDKKEVTAISAVHLYANKQYTDDFYDSCKNVQLSGLGSVMSVFCGPWGAKECNGERWLSYMGNNHNGLAPLMIYLDYPNSTEIVVNGSIFHPMKPDVVPCYESVTKGDPVCSCVDCPKSCHAPSE